MISRGTFLKILIIALCVIPVIYVGIQFNSVNSVKISLSDPELDIGISDSSELTDLEDVLSSKQLRGGFDLIVEGRGLLSTTVQSLETDVYIEDVFVGRISSDSSFRIPASGVERVQVDFMFDLSSLSPKELEDIADSIAFHYGEVKVGIDGRCRPVVLMFPVTLKIDSVDYVYLLDKAPQVTDLRWEKSESEIDDSVRFYVTLKNVFRNSRIERQIDVSIREEYVWASDVEAGAHRFSVELEPGESETISGLFLAYKESSTRGFFLRVYYGLEVIGEQASSYPPRMRVMEGDLRFESAYWMVGDTIVTTCDLGDKVQAHVVVKAYEARVLGAPLTVRIRKDLARHYDDSFLKQNFAIDLERGESMDIVLEFSPDEVSGPVFRGYYIDVEGAISFIMPDIYPPRLEVTE